MLLVEGGGVEWGSSLPFSFKSWALYAISTFPYPLLEQCNLFISSPLERVRQERMELLLLLCLTPLGT